MNTFGERLKFLRASASQSVLAEALGIPQTTLSNYERGRNEPDFKTVSLFCSHFGVNVEWLMFGCGPMRPGEPAQPAENAPEPPVTPVETASCARCAKMEAKMEKVEQQRDELITELREVNAENRRLAQENAELGRQCAVLEERQKTCCPDPLPYLKKKPEGEGSPNGAQVCA